MNILETIVEHTKGEIERHKQNKSVSALRELPFYGRETLSLRNVLENKRAFSVIAEYKRASPSAGQIGSGTNPASIALAYQRYGASAISILTDYKYFNGKITDIELARPNISIPILRKEFIVDEYQIIEAKAYGADAILLIAGILEKTRLEELTAFALSLGLESLVEVHSAEELVKVNFDTMKLIGINNRDLRSMTIDLNRSLDISKLLPTGITVVSESGIHSTNDIQHLKNNGIHAALIGEYLMKSEHPGVTLGNLLNGMNQ